MKIKNFTLQEFLYSETAIEKGIQNFPNNWEILENLLFTASKMQEIRDILWRPIRVTSGYRCLELNDAIDGHPKSQHMKGEACDFICPGFGTPAEIYKRLLETEFEFDQMIMEGGWIHISFKKTGNRNHYFVIE